MNRVVKDYLVLFGVGGTSIALDQWTKWLVRTNIEFGMQWLPDSLMWLSPYARIVHWYNKGAAFGMFQNGNIVFTILAFIVIGAIIYYYPRVEAGDWTLRLAMGLQLGGAAGNLIDRLRVGQVTDFISVGTFPVFNIADASISVGVAVLLLGVWLNERKEKLNAAQQSTPEGEQPAEAVLNGVGPVDGVAGGEQPKSNGGQS
ncbi:MAG TPA: signal peptidase II [Anaerolineales bacterium]|nr:signal peptidase II [Anaerolineales bacterium]HMV95120.1 signal peptidase II [Anaerolineales bacterium]HMZ41815.1 signal peptidase II [Anaerolineales bacterium]HND90795.1 signal peptidase II [Anaerolineales bacterium]HNE67891.1 signal peptidase II [Anaerolineales bacterium]